MARVEEAEREMKPALELEPLSVVCHLGVGWTYYYARDYDRAIAQYKRAMEIAPNLPMVLYELGLAYMNKKLYNQALAEFERAYTFSDGEPAAVMLLGHIHALLRRTEEAHSALAKLQEMSNSRYVPAFYRAFIYLGLVGEIGRVFEWLEKAYEDRTNYLIFLAVEPSMEPLRGDPRYQSLLQRVGLIHG
jgi:tetratricopeptide (TPR) repeat protein